MLPPLLRVCELGEDNGCEKALKTLKGLMGKIVIIVLFGMEAYVDGGARECDGARGCEGTRVPRQASEEAACISWV